MQCATGRPRSLNRSRDLVKLAQDVQCVSSSSNPCKEKSSMAGHYETLWETAKNLFESDSGRVIADIEKKNLAKDKKKVSELRDEKTDAPKLKKPAAKYWFGMRKSSGMEPACKKLDKAAGAKKQNENDIQKAYDDYDKDRKTYQAMLKTSARDEKKPYHLVPNQIKALEKAMVDIGEEFRNKYSKKHKQIRNGLIEQATDLSPFCDEMDRYLVGLARGDDRLSDKNAELGDHYKKVAAEEDEIINQKIKPRLLALQKNASDQGIPNNIDDILRSLKDKIKDHPFNSSDKVSAVRYWFSELKKDIGREIVEWEKLS